MISETLSELSIAASVLKLINQRSVENKNQYDILNEDLKNAVKHYNLVLEDCKNMAGTDDINHISDEIKAYLKKPTEQINMLRAELDKNIGAGECLNELIEAFKDLIHTHFNRDDDESKTNT